MSPSETSVLDLQREGGGFRGTLRARAGPASKTACLHQNGVERQGSYLAVPNREDLCPLLLHGLGLLSLWELDFPCLKVEKAHLVQGF